MKLVTFLKKHRDNWREILSSSPYNLIIKDGTGEFEGLTLFKYNQLDSDLSRQLVQNCRGIIIDIEDDFNVVSYPMDKFFNHGERHAKKIDWQTARVQQKVDGCFSSFNLVTMSDGSQMRFSDVYKSIKRGEELFVLSYNQENHCVEKDKIVAVKKKLSEPSEWLTITTRGQNCYCGTKPKITTQGRKSFGGRKKTVVTKNHSFFVLDNFSIIEKSADELNIGDTLLTRYPGFSPIVEQVLIGSLLGDGYIGSSHPNSRTEAKSLTITHSAKQKDYLLFKESLLHDELPGRLKEAEYTNAYSTEKVIFESLSNPALNLYDYISYNENHKKTITLELLSKLDWLGFAIWYMDDGSLNSACKSNSIHLHTERYTKEEVECIIKYFNSVGYKCYLREYRGYYMVNFSTQSSDEIWRKIREFIPDSMQYKLPIRHRGFFNKNFAKNFDNERKDSLVPIVITNIEEGITYVAAEQKVKNHYKYDLQTEKNHNYFCNGLLVHNSLIKVWHWNRKNKWVISTNGCIDAYSVKATSVSDTYETSHSVNFGKLFYNEFVKHCSFDKLNKRYTYMFELVSPEIKVVVDYGKNDIYHLCTRENKSGKYVEVDIGVQKPKEYPLHSLEACLNAAEKLNSNEFNEITDEGFVVVDGHYRRVKIKSPLYLAAQYLAGNKLSLKRCINIILANEESEYLAYFPEQKSAFDKVHSAVDKLAHTMENGYKFVLDSVGTSDRKEVALFIKENKFNYSGFYFKKMEIPELTAEQYMFGGYKKKLQNGTVKESLPLISIRELLKKATENLENREWWRY